MKASLTDIETNLGPLDHDAREAVRTALTITNEAELKTLRESIQAQP